MPRRVDMEQAVRALRGALLTWDPRVLVAPADRARRHPAPESLFAGYSGELETRILAEHGDAAAPRRPGAAVSGAVRSAHAQGGAPKNAFSGAGGAARPGTGTAPLPGAGVAAPSAGNAVTARASELATLYLPDDTAERRARFCDIYVRARSAGDASRLEDMDILRAYLLFDADAARALKYLQAYASLREVGFAEDAVSAALLAHDLDRDRALDQLAR